MHAPRCASTLFSRRPFRLMILNEPEGCDEQEIKSAFPFQSHRVSLTPRFGARIQRFRRLTVCACDRKHVCPSRLVLLRRHGIPHEIGVVGVEAANLWSGAWCEHDARRHALSLPSCLALGLAHGVPFMDGLVVGAAETLSPNVPADCPNELSVHARVRSLDFQAHRCC